MNSEAANRLDPTTGLCWSKAGVDSHVTLCIGTLLSVLAQSP